MIVVGEGVLLAPIVGQMDTRRAQLLTERLLRTVSADKTRRVILDVAGMVGGAGG